VFPQGFKSTRLLRAWLRRLAELGVGYRARTKFVGFSPDGAVRLAAPDGETERRPDVVVLAFGGASWPRLGGDGSWVAQLASAGVEIAPLAPGNMGLKVDWSEIFRSRFAGQPIKAARWSLGEITSRAEAMVTANGLEGGAVYALSAAARGAVACAGPVELRVDLAPDRSEAALVERLLRKPRASRSTKLAKAGISTIGAALMYEAGELPSDPQALAALAKACPVRVTGVAGLERAISSAGGVRWSAIDEHFMLLALPGVFVAGEMIDWEAPTGGYLLQACFSTGVAAARGALAYLSV
jgi:uncharacterized flavoprotein (TIGR03862 family)